MNFTFENQGTNTYLVYTIEPSDEIDSMSLGMMTNNKIPGLAPAIFEQMDTTKYIKYNISAKVSVKQFFTGAVNRKRLLGVFSGIVNAMISAEEYMIDAGSILLDLDYIYADVSTCETELICLPIMSDSEPVNLGAFFKNIVFGTQFDQTENCDYVARIINYLNSMSVFSLLEFKGILAELEEGKNLKQQEVQKPSSKIEQPAVPTIQKQPTIIPVEQRTIPQGSRQEITQEKRAKDIASQSMAAQKATNIQMSPFDMPAAEQPQHIEGKKKMSAMYLMMHYSKENKQKYKEQKEQTKKQMKTGVQSQNFAIPGQPSAAPVIQPASIPQNTPAPQQKPITTAPAPANPVQSTMPPQMVTGSANFGETTVLGGNTIGETTVLNAAQQSDYQPKPYLIRTKNNERILLDKPVFRIGKEKSYVDYFIGDNTAISRSHASIITRDGEFYIVDTNSTNHTYVNDVMLQSNAETKISGGTKIRLANEEFEFKLL